MTDSKRDHIYASKLKKVDNFVFDENVVNVFEDMIQRSVPGYSAINQLLPILANRFVQSNSNVYDLGCSLGEATLNIAYSMTKDGVKIIAIDNSLAMIDQLNQKINEAKINIEIETLCKDVEDVIIENASFVVLNYTLQFIDQDKRNNLVNKIYSGLKKGGALLLSEKVKYEDSNEDAKMQKQHELFKRNNDYSDLEISQKRESLENVLIADTQEKHMQRLSNAGFEKINQFAEYINFTSYVAIK